MKVRCQRIINETTQEERKSSPWLTIGKEYVVLEVDVYSNRTLYLLNDDGENHAPGLHDAKQFEVVSHHIPKNWVVNPGYLNIIVIGPKAWDADNFWDRCYEGDQETLNIYKQEARIIYEEELR